MNKTIRILTALFITFNMQAIIVHAESSRPDSNQPFIEDGKQWIVICATYEIYWTKTYYIDSDTMVAGQLCKKLMCHTEDYQTGADETTLYCCIYEDDSKVFYYPIDTTEPILLYDFNAMPGDTLSLGGQREDIHKTVCYQIWKNVALNYKSSSFHGQLATQYDSELRNVDEDSDVPYYEWYERIGSVFHPFEKRFFNKYMGGVTQWLYECRVVDKVIYSNTLGITLTTGLYSMKKVPPSWEQSVFDLSGRRLDSEPEKGLYIKNGRKYLKR